MGCAYPQSYAALHTAGVAFRVGARVRNDQYLIQKSWADLDRYAGSMLFW